LRAAKDCLSLDATKREWTYRSSQDEQQTKETFVTLLGVERARQRAELLVEQALERLRPLGEQASLTEAIARFAMLRDC
jgi:farnesyl diphosphate synthase